MKVIVADDSMVIRKIISKVIESMEHTALHAASGPEVVSLLEQEGEEVGLVLLDWNMPLLGGMEVLTFMQDSNGFKSIPVIMVSTESEGKNIEKALAAGAKGYLTKPFKPEQLQGKIQEILG